MEGQVDVRARPRDDLRCPLCLDLLAGEEASADCRACATPHHEACLRELGGCAVLGCAGALPDVAPPDRERAAIQARARSRARRFVKGEGLGAPVATGSARRELRPDLHAEDDDRRFWWAERWLWTRGCGLTALAAFGLVAFVGHQQGWPGSAALLNGLVAGVVVGIGGVFVVHARAPRR